MKTFFATIIRTGLNNPEAARENSFEITASDMADAVRQLSAFEAGLAASGFGMNIERLSTKPTRGVKYERAW